MKILGGRLKGRNIYMPKDLRVTQNVVKKAIFDIIGHDMTDLTFLDLFAGSGAIGIEAISRGAKFVCYVEKEPKNAKTIRENASLYEIEGYEIINRDVFAGIKEIHRNNESFNVIFMDPPYGAGLVKKALKTLDAYDILQPNYTLAIQHDKREILPESIGRFLLFRQKSYGSTFLSFYVDKPS